ncbi:hypothetical protein BD770DRAFT_393212 [Pilaira anomala]|nr:hypothetical protein BD770DRAFT_393212 [Pilaira anomala]
MVKVKCKKAKEAPPPEESTESEASNSSGEGDNGYGTPVRPRKRFALEETRLLEDEFKKNARPTADVKKKLADTFDTVPNRIQIWFQNRRAKEKKITVPASAQDSESSSHTSEKAGNISDVEDPQEEDSRGSKRPQVSTEQVQHFRPNFQFFDQAIIAPNTDNWPSRGVDPRVIFPTNPNASMYNGMYPNNYMAPPFVFGNAAASVAPTTNNVSRALGHQREDEESDERHYFKRDLKGKKRSRK